MTTLTPLFRALATAALVSSLAACSTTAPVAVDTKPKLTDILAQASQAEKSGNKEQAVTLWKQAATAYPADKTPWGSIAKTRFDAGLYGEAIVAAQEVLIRDPNDKAAHSIIATSGIRLATKSVGDLSRMNGFSGSLRAESQELARVLRDSLGMSDDKAIFATTSDKDKEPKPRPGGNRSNGNKVRKTVESAKTGDKDLLDLIK